MFPLGVGLLIIGYGVSYWAIINFRNGGDGPGFAEVMGLTQSLNIADGPGKGVGRANLTGQPATSNPSPGAVTTYV